MSNPRPNSKILCFGEMLLRFSPNQNELLLQSPALTARPGGAEANVAVALARFGAPAAMATVLPDNALGQAARDEVRRFAASSRHSDGAGRLCKRPLARGSISFFRPVCKVARILLSTSCQIRSNPTQT